MLEHPVSESFGLLAADETDALGEVDEDDDADDIIILLPVMIIDAPTPTRPGSVLVQNDDGPPFSSRLGLPTPSILLGGDVDEDEDSDDDEEEEDEEEEDGDDVLFGFVCCDVGVSVA